MIFSDYKHVSTHVNVLVQNVMYNYYVNVVFLFAVFSSTSN